MTYGLCLMAYDIRGGHGGVNEYSGDGLMVYVLGLIWLNVYVLGHMT